MDGQSSTGSDRLLSAAGVFVLTVWGFTAKFWYLSLPFFIAAVLAIRQLFTFGRRASGHLDKAGELSRAVSEIEFVACSARLVNVRSIEEQVFALEHIIEARLPDDYRAFVLAKAGDTIQELQYYMPHPEGRWVESIDEFYAVESLLQMMPLEIDLRRQGVSDHPLGTLPIAHNGCGDTVLLSYREQDFGSVYHEFLEEGDADDLWAGVYLLATSFTEWLNQLGTYAYDDELNP